MKTKDTNQEIIQITKQSHRRQFSIFCAPAKSVKPMKTIGVIDVYKYITKHMPAMNATNNLRAIKDAKEAREFKTSHFDFVTFSGVFSYRKDDCLVEHSGLLCLDFDHVGNSTELLNLREKLIADPHFTTWLLFTSPSGDGLKWVVGIDISKYEHLTWFRAIQNYIRMTYGIEVDEKCGNVSRCCFLPHDSSCYINRLIFEKNSMCKEEKEFDPLYWVNKNKDTEVIPQNANLSSEVKQVKTSIENDDIVNQVRELTAIIVGNGSDITTGYDNWLNLGFALVDGLGEGGREYFHELSKMNNEYNAAECEKQYDACLKSNGSGVTINTFFYLAKKAGIDMSTFAREHKSSTDICADCADEQQCVTNRKEDNTLIINGSSTNEQLCANAQTAQKSDNGEYEISFNHTFSDKIQEEEWCDYFKPVLASMEDIEGRDKMILGTLVLNSGIIPNYYGIYSNNTVYPPMYLIFYGPSASRKGEIASCQYIIKPLKDEIVGQYQLELEDYKMKHSLWESNKRTAERGEEPQEPEYRSPVIPANSSASAAYLALQANGGWGVMFETEAAVLNKSLLSDYGDYSAGLLAAFHHEPIKMNRVKDKIRFEIDEPRWAIGMTCTPGLLPKLFPTFEDGLGNRFLYYGLNRKLVWNNPFKKIEKPLNEVYEDLGKESLNLYHMMKQLGNRRIQFFLKDNQIDEFNNFFSDLLMEQFSMLGDGITSFIFRLGFSTFRIAMILTLLRRYSDRVEGKPLFADNEQAILCSDKDFNITMTIMNTLVNHTATIYAALAKDDEGLGNKKLAILTQQERTFYDALSDEFTSGDIKATADRLHMNQDTVRRYVGSYVTKYHVAERVKNGSFRKVKK